MRALDPRVDAGFDAEAARWSSTLSSKVKLPHAMNFRALCGATLVTLRSTFRANKPLELHRVVEFQEASHPLNFQPMADLG